MAKKLLTSYTFTPGAENVGTVVVPGTYTLEQFLLITNVSNGTILFQFNVPARGGTVTSAGGNTTLTLEIDTRAMTASDRLQVFVDDGQNAQVTLTNASVEISNDAGNAVPVSTTTLPLPNGAATSANQATANSSLASLDGKAPALLSGRVPVDGSGVTQPVSGPLTDTQLRASAVSVAPTVQLGMGVATAITQRVTLATDGSAVTALTSIDNKTPALVSGRQPVDGSGVTQPISAASLPLPTGAATETTLSSVNGKLPALDTGAVPVLVKNGQLEIQNDTGNPIPVGPAATLQLTGSASALNADLFSVDCSQYRGINFQITGTWVGTISFQVSNDNTNWSSLALFTAASGTSLTASTASNNALYGSLGGFNYVRIRFTAYTSGTANVVGYLLRESISSATNAVTSMSITSSATVSAGTILYTVNSAASTNAANIKSSAANLYGISAMNTTASTKYVRLFNLTTAPTVGTSVPIMVVAIPATSSKEIEYVPALRFGTGLAVAITGGAAATDSTAVAAGDVQLLVSYA